MNQRMTIESANKILSRAPSSWYSATEQAQDIKQALGFLDGYQAEQVRAMEKALETALLHRDGRCSCDERSSGVCDFMLYKKLDPALAVYRAGLPKEGHAR